MDDHVLIYVHRQEHLDEVMRQFPAERYVLVDDKPRILAMAKAHLGTRLVTLHVCQDAHAHASEQDTYPAPDGEVSNIADLQALGPADFSAGEQ